MYSFFAMNFTKARNLKTQKLSLVEARRASRRRQIGVGTVASRYLCPTS